MESNGKGEELSPRAGLVGSAAGNAAVSPTGNHEPGWCDRKDLQTPGRDMEKKKRKAKPENRNDKRGPSDQMEFALS